MTRLRDRRVLLTGASQGIGPFIAAALAGRGCHLALTARSEQLLRELAGRLDGSKIEVGIFPCDLLEADQRTSLIHDVLERFGRIDILVNNAGVENEGPFLDQPGATHRRTIELNLLAPIELTHAMLPTMLEQGAGHIVNSRPLKPLLALAALSPRLAGWLMRRLGVVDFQRRKVGR
jgi:short-subunit dehydrogenase